MHCYNEGDTVIILDSENKECIGKVGEIVGACDGCALIKLNEYITYKNLKSNTWFINTNKIKKYYGKNKRLS